LKRREPDPGGCDADGIVAAHSPRRLKDQSCTEVAGERAHFTMCGSNLQK
jgi:hypothetical protein